MWLERLIALAIQHRLGVTVLFLLAAATGLWAASQMRIDALPDLTNNQVQVLAEARGYAPVEVEKLVTFPIEVAMQGLPRVKELRSISRFGLSVVTVVFDDAVDPFFARQVVFERLQQARSQLPIGLEAPVLGPMSSGMGEIYMYTLESKGSYDPIAMRTLQDWVVKPQLRTVPGVTEINSFGGLVKQIQVLIHPEKLVAKHLSLHEVLDAVAQTSSVAGGNFIEHNKEQYIVRGLGLAQNLDDVRDTVITTRHGVSVFVRDIADVTIGAEVRQGAVTENGKGEVVSGIVMMLRGENSRAVIKDVKRKVAAINETLPEGVKIVPYYDQTELVNETIHTVEMNLLEGGLLVVAVLFLFLRDVDASLLVASTIPLSMGFAFIGMQFFNLSANLMSLGAIDFGLIVDGAVVMAENAKRQLRLPANRGRDRRQIVLDSAREVARPIFFGVGIILLVYLPILTLQDLEGKMFTPMALTVCFALAGSLLLALFFVPAVATWVLPVPERAPDESTMLGFKGKYARSLRWSMQKRWPIPVVALVVALLGALLMTRLGTEFMPEMDEGSILVEVRRLPSISLTEAIATQKDVEKALWEFPEVRTIVSRTGRPDIASDPMGVHMTDTFVMLKPRSTWKHASREALEDDMRERLARLPGVAFSFTQPIAMRVDELVSGVKSDVAVKLFGEDLDVLTRTADQIAAVVAAVPGAKEVNVEPLQGQTYLNIRIDRHALARYGSSVNHVQEVVEAAIGGRVVGEMIEGQRRFQILVKLPEERRGSLEAIRALLIDTPSGGMVPLAQVADIRMEEGPAQVSREDGQRRIVIEANVGGRDLGSFVKEAQQRVHAQVALPPTYHLGWGGQFENQQRAMNRLALVVPVAIGLIFLLLYTAFGSLAQAGAVMLILPLAVAGGVAALWLRGLHFGVSAAIGFVALFGIAVLNGVVLMSTSNRLREEGAEPVDAAVEAASTRLRPVLMTALVASLGFLPMAISNGAGAEVQRPLATVVIGGLVTATALTLYVLPALYAAIARRRRN